MITLSSASTTRSSAIVEGGMLAVSDQFEVPRVVVESVLVLVMNDLVVRERATEDPLDYHVVEVSRDRAVCLPSSTTSTARVASAEDDDVPVCVDARTPDRFHPSFAVEALERLGRSGADVIVSRRPTSMTVAASANLRVAVGFASFRDGRPKRRTKSFSAFKFGLTLPRAGEAFRSRWGFSEPSAADRTDKFDRHSSILPLVTTEGKKNV